MARHPWVAKADDGIRFGIQLCAEDGRRDAMDRDIKVNPYDALMESGKLVDQLGFDGLFIYDHPGQAPDPWVWLSGLASVTENVMLGSVVNCVFHRYPTYLARLATDLDHLSGGRLMLGLGIGYLPEEFKMLGVEFMPNRDRFRALEEVIQIIQGSWGDEPFSFDGEYYQVENIRVLPPPVQERPPIMIAGSGEQVTLRQVAKWGDACNFNRGATPDETRHKLDVLKQHCADFDRDYEEILRTDFTGWLIMAPTEAELQQKLAGYYPGGIPDSLDYLGVTAGTPEQIAEKFQSYVDAGIQYFVVQLVDGSDRETIQLLADQVVPAMQK